MDELTRAAVGDLTNRVEMLEKNVERLADAGAKMAAACIELTNLVKEFVE